MCPNIEILNFYFSPKLFLARDLFFQKQSIFSKEIEIGRRGFFQGRFMAVR
jgi:hypothetical protein